MADSNSKLTTPLNLPVKVWVLAPQIQTNDENIDYYYDFSQSIAEYTKTFAELQLEWKWQPVSMDNFNEIICSIEEERDKKEVLPVVFNICDGDEANGTPGVSVVRLLEEKKLFYTGANEFFYNITTSKISMKIAFDKAGVLTPAWEAILSEDQDIAGLFERLGSPLIIKPSVSGGSMGVGTKNVVYNEADAKELIKTLFKGYRGWNLVTDGLIAESFIRGPEFTSFITGSFNKPSGLKVYEPVERVFHNSLPEDEKFLSFDRLWEIYEEESAMPREENFYEYGPVDPCVIDAVKKISLDAYASVKGTGYTRIDIRMNADTRKLYVLEVNAQCGISEDEDFTSIGAILKATETSFTQLVKEIIQNAFERNDNPAAKKRKTMLVNISNAG